MRADEVYVLLNKKINGLLSGVDHVQVDGQNLIFYFTNGSHTIMYFPTPPAGTSIVDVKIKSVTTESGETETHLISVMSDGTEIDAGELPSGSGEGGVLFTDKPPTVSSAGGVKVGTNLNNLTCKEIWEKVFWPYTPVTISIQVSPNITLQEKGTKLSGATITAKITNQNTDPEFLTKWVKFYVNNTLVETKSEGIGNSVTFTYNNEINTDITFKVECTDGKTTPNATHKIQYVNRSFYGVVPEGTQISVDMIEGLGNNVLKNTKNLNWDGITGVNCQIVYAYPSAFGTISSVIDRMNLQCRTSYTYSQIERAGEMYNVYMLTDAASVTNVLQVFT